MADHTPTPWKVVSKPEFSNGLTYTSIQPVTPDEPTMRPLAMANGEFHVCRMSHTAAEHIIAVHRANAAFIVKAVNNHDALVKALQRLVEIDERRPPLIEALIRGADQYEHLHAYNAAMSRARAALQEAGR